MKKKAVHAKRLSLSTETIITLSKLSSVRGGDSSEPTGSLYHNLCNSVGCPKPF